MSEWEGHPGRVCIARVPLVSRLGRASAGYEPSGSHITRHGFIWDFRCSGEGQEDKSFRDNHNIALVRRINISSRTTGQALLCWTGILL